MIKAVNELDEHEQSLVNARSINTLILIVNGYKRLNGRILLFMLTYLLRNKLFMIVYVRLLRH